MTLLQKNDLRHTYSWSHIPPDDPKLTGEPDSTLFNRREGYEVIYLINKFATDNNWNSKEPCYKLEEMIYSHLPSDKRSHKHVREWIIGNWNNF